MVVTLDKHSLDELRSFVFLWEALALLRCLPTGDPSAISWKCSYQWQKSHIRVWKAFAHFPHNEETENPSDSETEDTTQV